MKNRKNTLIRALLAVVACAAAFATPVVLASPAAADGCYTWSGTLRKGDSGEGVTRLQIRVAGWMTSGQVLAIDGSFGPATEAAVKRFQAGYGLAADGVVGPATLAKIYALQDDDCSPAHFAFTESNNCGNRGDFSGGRVSTAAAKENFLRAMWKAEAIRHKRGDIPMTVTSGFRSIACNSSVGGSPTSRHPYGDAIDFGGSKATICSIASVARTSGFPQIFGPGYPGHSDHAHVASGTNQIWDFSDC
ncbi:MAG: D-Ala-D-Ala carboxypeptidase family metallohydrolase [Nocardioides sp.]